MIDKKKNTLNDNQWVFNGQTYEVIIELSNSGEASVPISLASVIALSITESIHSIFPSVELVLDTSGNYIENAVNSTDTNLRERVFSTSYNFNADGRDSFFIYLSPVFANGQQLDNDQYILAGWYFIYDEDETVQGRGTAKQKTFYLRNVREQQLIEGNLQWSTSDVVKSESQYMYNLSQLSNHFRKAKTGLAIKHLLSKAFNDSSSYDKDWDEGHTSVYYSSNADNTAYDDVEYVLDRHISSSGLDNCILKLERNQNFSLRSIEHYFKYGVAKDYIGPYISDIFAAETGNFSSSIDPDVVGAVLPGHFFAEGDLPLFDGLSSFSLLHVANTDSSENLISNVVHSYDNTSKQFNIECNGHHILRIKDKMQQLYADKMPGRRGDDRASIIVPINEKKVDNSILKHTVSTSGLNTERLYSGINKVMKKSLALSPCINFDIEGSSHRTTCRFMLMTLRNADKDAALTKLLVGEWFTTKVNHAFIFTKNTFINNVTCVKPHTNEKLGVLDINLENLQQRFPGENLETALRDF